MKKLLLIGMMLLMMVSSVMAFSGLGSGTALDPYQITNAYQLNETRDDLTADYILMSDIDLGVSPWNDQTFTLAGAAGIGWEPIGDYIWDSVSCFTGTFDGQGHTITNLFINASEPSDAYAVGFFKCGYDECEIKNLNFENSRLYADGMSYMGTAIGDFSACNLENIHVINGIVHDIDGYEIGGIAGSTWESNTLNYIRNCSFEGSVYGYTEGVGGIVGALDTIASGFLVEECKANGTIYAGAIDNEWGAAGGIVGSINAPQWLVTINNSYFAGDVTAHRASGLVGRTSASFKIENSYFAGTLAGIAVGSYTDPVMTSYYPTFGSKVINCSSVYWDSTLSSEDPTSPSYCFTHGTALGKTTAEMQTEATFIGWDFVTLWYMQTYPEFVWNLPPPIPPAPQGSGGVNWPEEVTPVVTEEIIIPQEEKASLLEVLQVEPVEIDLRGMWAEFKIIFQMVFRGEMAKQEIQNIGKSFALELIITGMGLALLLMAGLQLLGKRKKSKRRK